MKKLIICCIVGIFVLSGINAVASQASDRVETAQIEQNIVVSLPQYVENDGYYKVVIPETSFYLQREGKPFVPLVPVSFDLPFKSQDISIQCIPKNIEEYLLSGKLMPSPQTYVLDGSADASALALKEDSTVYSVDALYPEVWSDYRITCGLDTEGNHVTHVSVYLYPVRYNPVQNSVQYTTDYDILIDYTPTTVPQTYLDDYELVIITSPELVSSVEPLMEHKIDNGITTMIKTTDEIYDEFTGFDKPEQIKRFIEYCDITYNTSYVLLFGGLKSYYNADDRDDANQGWQDWYVPVRYTNIKKSGGTADPGAISDLYYADLYNGTGAFEDWNSNDDEYIANWGHIFGAGTDTCDFNPDIYVSRLPVRNKFEARIVINKIIKYETTTPASKDWLSTMIGVAGISFNTYLGQPDGEYLCDIAMTYMEPKTTEEKRIYASNEGTSDPIPIAKDIRKTISEGAGYVLFEGHGNPLSWNVHKADGHGWVGGIKVYQLPTFTNFKKLPIIVIGGCHNGQLNVTFYKTKHSSDYNGYYWTYDVPTPVCFNWMLMITPWGGAIATIGNTGLGIGASGQPMSYSAILETNYFYAIGQDGASTFSQAHAQSISKYIDTHTIGITDAHCLTIYQAFGDPSLHIGGFE